jgi:hypothetical protein
MSSYLLAPGRSRECSTYVTKQYPNEGKAAPVPLPQNAVQPPAKAGWTTQSHDQHTITLTATHQTAWPSLAHQKLVTGLSRHSVAAASAAQRMLHCLMLLYLCLMCTYIPRLALHTRPKNQLLVNHPPM